MDPLPDDIRRFVDGNVESIDQLEILRVLGEDVDRAWTVAELAEAVQGTPAAVAAHAAALHARGLIAAGKREAEATFRYGPGTPALEALVRRLLDLYRQRPVSMIRLIYDRQKDPLRSFSDAFRIRKPPGGE